MEKWVDAADIGELKDGMCKALPAKDGSEIALFCIQKNFYAISNACSHMGGPLSEGRVKGKIVTCPWHGWQIDVTTGGFAIDPSAPAQKVYPTRITKSKVQVRIA